MSSLSGFDRIVTNETSIGDSIPSSSPVDRRTRLGFLFVTIPVLVALDQWTKRIATDQLMGEPAISLWGGLARLQYARNRGAFLGAGDALSTDARFLILTVGTGVLLLGVGFFLLRRWEMPRLRFGALLLILAGGIGNLIDRILYGFVVDFMVVGLGVVRTGIFNVADVLITTAVVLLVFDMTIGHKDEPDEPKVPNES